MVSMYEHLNALLHVKDLAQQADLYFFLPNPKQVLPTSSSIQNFMSTNVFSLNKENPFSYKEPFKIRTMLQTSRSA
jgi:hypothetical protein